MWRCGWVVVVNYIRYNSDNSKICGLPYIGRITISMYGADFNSQIMDPWFSKCGGRDLEPNVLFSVLGLNLEVP